MTTIITQGFISIDAGQGNGAVTVSTTFEIDGPILEDARDGRPFAPFGNLRQTELPGLIAATRFTGMYVPADQSVQLYTDLIASFDDNTQVTVVLRRVSGAASTTNNQYTITGTLMKGPSSGIQHGEKIHYPFDLAVDAVVWTDGSLSYTW